MSFRIAGLQPHLFDGYRALDEAALSERAARRVAIDAPHSAPCRVTLDDVAPGEEALLVNFDHQPAHSPYRQMGPIYVSQTPRAPFEGVDVIPPALARRTLSLRGFDESGMMLDADLTEGADAAALIERLFANSEITYIHAHYARRGCFAARIDRA